MKNQKRIKSPIAKRLRDARNKLGISQKALGIKAGIDEFSASSRINHYEQSVHQPDLPTAKRLAKVLGVPVPYLYTEDDALAEFILLFAAANQQKRKQAAEVLKSGK